MNLLQQFVDFLSNQKPARSWLTVKNYKADIGQFITWFETVFKLPFDPAKITLQTLRDYKQARNLSENSFARHTSSLRKFFSFLKEQGIILFDLFPAPTYKAKIEEDPWMIHGFKNFLQECRKSNLTIKNYINDIKSFFLWLEEVALVKYSWNVEDKNLLSKINSPIIEQYKERLMAAKFSPLTINRKLSSLRSYVGWAKNQGFIPESMRSLTNENVRNSEPQTIPQPEPSSAPNIQEYSSFPPERLMQKSAKGIGFLFDHLFILPLAQMLETTQYLFWKASGKKIFKKTIIGKFKENQPEGVSNIKKEFYAPLTIATSCLPAHRRVWHFLRHVRPNWYKQYHSYSFAHYFHFSILMILSCAAGFGIYNNLIADTQTKNAVLGTSTSAPPRILSFQGKLTDSSSTAITKETDILFSLYDDETASTAAALWQETDTVQPDSDGVFSIFLGKKTAIPDTTFSQNSKLFLGITVGSSPELRPRQELATVPFASNAETLQGLEPITNSTKVSNVVLALDSSGNLSIGGTKAHTFQTIGGQFVLSGKILSLTTVPGSNSNIEIVPDGLGKIDLSRPIQNSTNNGNFAVAVGSVEFDDTVAILATTSAQSALYINQTSTGGLISAYTNGSAKFTVGNDGEGTFNSDLTINGGDITSTATTFNLLNATVTTLNIGGAATTLNLGIAGGATTVKSDLTVNEDFTLPSLTSNGGILYTNASGKILQVSAGTSSDCLMGGTTPTFGSCGSGGWSSALGAISPSNSTFDLLLGSTATSSALIKLTGTNIAGTNDSWFNAGNIGIGTTSPLFRLDLQDSRSSTAAAQIFNADTGTDADGLIVKLGNTSATTVDSTNHFISFETAGIGVVGSIQGDGTSGVTYATSGIADFAEYIKKDRNETIEFGSTICLSTDGLAVKCNGNNNKMIGVASERPAFLGGKNLGDGSIAVGLIGQIETLVTASGGEIKAGDALSASAIPGVAIRTTGAGQIVGKALDSLTITDDSEIAGYYDPDNNEYRSKADFPNIPLKANIVRVYKIPVLVNVSWHDPNLFLTQSGNLNIYKTASGEYSVKSPFDETLSNIGGFLKIVAADVQAGIVNASEIVTQTLIVTSDSVIVNGQSLKDYIVQTVKESGIMNQESGITSPIISTNKLASDVISPLSDNSNISISLHDSSFVIHNSANATGSAVARIDSEGKIIANNVEIRENLNAESASISGSLNANNASISGTLRAGNIIADSISGLDARISDIYSTSFANLASYSAQLSNVPDLYAETAQFNQGLMVFGPTSLLDLSISERLSIGGSMFITQNSIETLDADLSLQSLRQGGLSIMAGLIYIDTQGNLTIQGDLTVNGKLAVNIIAPLPTSDLVINNASGSAVLSINQTGDIVASGSGTFAKIKFSFVAPVLAVSATEAIASSSAGVADIGPYQSEITIRNPLVTDKSVIYITPVGTPSAQTPFLMRQIPEQTTTNEAEGSFTVGVQSPTNHSLNFNWLIIN